MSGATGAARRVDHDDLPFVTATVNYSAKIDRARSDLVDPSNTYRPLIAKTVKIKDARPIRHQLSLDNQGFVLVDHKSSVSHLRDPKLLDKTYHRELTRVVQDVTDADIVLPYKNYLQVRLSPRAPGESGNDLTRPAGFVHYDLTQETFANFIRWVQEAEGVSIKNFSRAMFVQSWRAVSEPPQDYPLALTDGRSTKPGNYVIMDNITTLEDDGQSVETRLGLYDPDDDWYYFSNMRSDELLLFVGNDTKYGDNLSVLHTGFDNTPKYPNASPRESIETRFVAFWK